jgi:hypothetical protein
MSVSACSLCNSASQELVECRSLKSTAKQKNFRFAMRNVRYALACRDQTRGPFAESRQAKAYRTLFTTRPPDLLSRGLYQ